MKKLLFSLNSIDFLMFLIALLLLGTSVSAFSISLVTAIILLFCFVVQITYIILSIKSRMKLYVEIDNQKQTIEETEKVIGETLNADFLEVKQKILESMIETTLTSAFPKAKVMKNVFVPMSQGGTTEIDVLVINNDGVFLFEAKNYSAKLLGNWASDKLKAIYSNGQEVEVDNPIIQNSFHYKHISNLLSKSQSGLIKNIVVLGGNTTYDKAQLKMAPTYSKVCSVQTLVYAVNNKSAISKNILTDDEVKSIYDTFSQCMSYSDEKKEKHISNLKANG